MGCPSLQRSALSCERMGLRVCIKILPSDSHKNKTHLLFSTSAALACRLPSCCTPFMQSADSFRDLQMSEKGREGPYSLRVLPSPAIP